MKIGIITTYSWFKSTYNYGSGLQAYALIDFLRKKGHEAFLICNTSGVYPELEYSCIFSHCKHYFYRYYVAAKSLGSQIWKNKWDRKQTDSYLDNKNISFAKFLESCIPHTNEMSGEQVMNDPPDADAYIAGSDQIWQGVNALNFLSFASVEKKTLIYAASSAWASLNTDWKKSVKKLISIPQYVSVREDVGLLLCKELGRNDAALVCDPTLLLMPDQYKKAIVSHQVEATVPEHTLLVYLLNIRNKRQMHLPKIYSLSKQLGTEIRIIPCQGSRPYISTGKMYEPSPLEWCSAIDQARYMLTNSYHGMIFSILMHTPFLVMSQENKEQAERARFDSLLKILGLEHRIHDPAKTLLDQMRAPIDWDSVDARLTVFRKKSEAFIMNALS